MADQEPKVFNDPVHGTIKLEPLLVQIIDTPEFQRLRHIKQQGGVYYVYPGAQHNRFEHSIRTAHLAGKLVTHLRQSQPDLEIDDRDVLCVKIAGLCHDMGHGPFSHLFDDSFINNRHPEFNWTHEKASCDMFERALNRIDVDEYYLNNHDRIFVKELINGPTGSGEWPYRGRGEDKSFLFHIISNKDNGIDVDKWDYFARDCHHLGIPNGFDHNRLIEFSRVLEVDVGNRRLRKAICFRDKEIFNLYEMFHTRFTLHKRACKHQKVQAIEMMISDALSEADDHIRIYNPGHTSSCSLSDCVKTENLGSFCNLDDRVLQKIEQDDRGALDPAKTIIKRMSNGDQYKCIGKEIIRGDFECDLTYQVERYIECNLGLEFLNTIKASVVTFNYGSKANDPIQSCWFYKKTERDTPIKISREEVSSLLPSRFQEHEIQVFCKKEKITSRQLNLAYDEFKRWYDWRFPRNVEGHN